MVSISGDIGFFAGCILPTVHIGWADLQAFPVRGTALQTYTVSTG